MCFIFLAGLNDLRNLPNSDVKLPYFIAGDAAFPLTTNLIHPYGGSFLPDDEDYFNQRFSRARGVIENTFGILAARWRIFHQVIEFEADTVDKIIQATVALHNFLMDDRGRYSSVDARGLY
jgi:hypothetical protein